MSLKLSTLPLLACLCVPACAAEDAADGPESSATGKSDAVDGPLGDTDDEPQQGTLRCAADKEPIFGVFEGGSTDDGETIDPSDRLVDEVGEPRSISRDDLLADGLLLDQVKTAVLHIFSDGQGDIEGVSLDEIFALADSDGYFFIWGEAGGVNLDWVRFFAGDTEVGVVFEKGTTTIIADISDGDIRGCGPE